MLELAIQNGGNIFYPVVEEGITWETERKGVPGKLTFSVVKDGIVDLQEGNAVSLKVDDTDLFYALYLPKSAIKAIQFRLQLMTSYAI